MAARWQAFTATWIAALVAGCGGGPVQCAPCPPPAYVNVVTHEHTPPTGIGADTVRICVQGLATCESRPVGGGTVSLTLPAGMTPRQLDGRTVTATATRETDGATLTGSADLAYRQGSGVCACSGVSAEITVH